LDFSVRTVLIASSAVNLAFIRVSKHLLLRPQRYYYCIKRSPSDGQIVAFLLAFVFGTALVAGSILLAHVHIPSVENFVTAFVLLLSLAIGGLGVARLDVARLEELLRRLPRAIASRCERLAIALVMAGLGICLWRFGPRQLLIVLENSLLWTSPLTLIPFWLILKTLANRHRFEQFGEQSPAVFLTQRQMSTQRVVWMLFDELDQRIAFDQRPTGLKLPEMDRFLSQAVVCSAAYPPSRCTEISISAFFTGRLIDETVKKSPRTLSVFFSGDSEARSLNTLTTIFHRLRSRSLNCGVLAYYHPFGRLFGDVVAEYCWKEYPTQENAITGSIPHMVVAYFRTLLETWGRSPFGTSLAVQKAIRNYKESQGAALRLASDPRIDVAFLHWPIPHAPFIYNSCKNDIVPKEVGPKGYLDNLALVDRSLGEIRHEMQAAGVWDKSLVILTTDHWWRAAPLFDGKKSLRVPFAIHFPCQEHRVEYDRRLNTVIVHDLILAIVDHVINDPTDLTQWLDHNRVEAPPTKV
jgi:hypothetical protein